MAVHLAVASDIFDGVLFCAVLFSHVMSWMRSGTESLTRWIGKMTSPNHVITHNATSASLDKTALLFTSRTFFMP